jgi:excisionase family DNA binding protein
MEKIVLMGITTQELTDIIKSSIIENLSSHPEKLVRYFPDEFLNRFQVAELLKISLTTLNDWTKKGYLKAYRIGNRVLFRHEDVLASLQEVKNLKYKRG